MKKLLVLPFIVLSLTACDFGPGKYSHNEIYCKSHNVNNEIEIFVYRDKGKPDAEEIALAGRICAQARADLNLK